MFKYKMKWLHIGLLAGLLMICCGVVGMMCRGSGFPPYSVVCSEDGKFRAVLGDGSLSAHIYDTKQEAELLARACEHIDVFMAEEAKERAKDRTKKRTWKLYE